MKNREPLTMEYSFAIVALLCTIGLRFLMLFFEGESTVFSYLKAVLMIALYTSWGISFHQRLTSSLLRKYITLTSVMVVFWVFIRSCKYLILTQNGTAARYIWYLYYIPLLFIPFLTLLSAASIWKPDRQPQAKKLYLLAIIPAVLFGFVITNDLHQLVFSFPTGSPFSQTVYTHQIIYWLCAAWILLGELTGLLILLKKAKVNNHILWLPFAVFTTAVLYCAMILLHNPWIHFAFRQTPDALCFFTMAIWESCIICRMIPSNTNYEQLFKASTISAQILSSDGTVHYVSENAPAITPEIIERTKQSPFFLDEDRFCKSSPVTGGRILYVEDISAVNQRVKQLQEVQEELAGTNDLLKAEIRLKQKRVKVKEQNRLYDKMAEAVSQQINKAEKVLVSDSMHAEDKWKNLAYLCVLGSYIKRRSNLILLYENAPELPSEELCKCIQESIDNLNIYGIHSYFTSSVSGTLPAEICETIYDVFEAAVEASLVDAHSFLAILSIHDHSVEMKMQQDGSSRPDFTKFTEACQQIHASIQTDEEDGIAYVTLLVKGDIL